MASDLVFLHGALFPDCRAHIDKQFDGYHTLQFMSAGSIRLAYDERETALEGAWFWPAFPGPRIQFAAAPGTASWVHRYVAFSGPRVGRWAAEGLLLTAPQPKPATLDAPAAFDALLEQVKDGNSWNLLRATNLLENLLLELAEARSQTGPVLPWLTPLLAAMADGETFTLDYDTFAAAHGLALSTLRQSFKAAVGVSVHSYAIQCRIARARSLVGDTDLPFKTIAARLGYDDVYFFTRQFHQHVGVPPGVFRKSRQF